MLHASRRLGQHFLVSRTVLANIVAAANLAPTDTVLEIGPGRGILTFALAEQAGRVIAVEKDPRLAEALERELLRRTVGGSRQRNRQAHTNDRRYLLTPSTGKNITLLRGDILKLFPDQLPLPHDYRVVANIPYYLTSRLIRRLLESDRRPQNILLTVQQEVAERMIAKPPRMNRLAIAVQAYGTPEVVERIPASAFSPRPKVDSALIRISNISTEFFDAAATTPERFFAMIRQAFSQRRKTLTNSLAPLFPSKAAVREALKTIGRAETARPQELSLKDWARMASRL